MSVLDRASLEASPLADLHALASELSLDSYRRLRKPALIDAILQRQGGADAPASAADSDQEPAVAEAPTAAEASEPSEASARAEDEDEAPSRRRRGRRGGRARTVRDEDSDAGADADEKPPRAEKPEKPEKPVRGEKAEKAEKPEPRTRERKRPASKPDEPAVEVEVEAETEATAEPVAEDVVVEGVVELLPNGSGFVRVAPPEPSDEDVYISAAQVKRCELVSGDKVAGPRRAPRRSERFASLVRIDTINGRPADEVADSARFDDLPAAFPTERFKLGSEDPTLKAIEWLTPFGRGSRVTITGPTRAGKTEALRRLATALAAQEGIQVTLALAGVRPEETGEWSQGPVSPAVSVSLAFSPDAQASAVELVVDQARRVAARGTHAVVLIDTLDGLHPHVARRAIAAARNLVDSGSLTIIATASEPIGGETTVIALDRSLTSSGRFPAVDLIGSGTIRPELLVGEAAAGTIASARAEALES